MRKRLFSIIFLFILIFVIPFIIYFLSTNINSNSFKVLYEDIFRKMGVSETSKITSSIESKELRGIPVGTTGSYTWGSFEKVYSNWSVPYTVTQEQYGEDSSKVGYFVYLGWPVIKAADTSYKDDIDTQGTDHSYYSWIHKYRLANHDGHRQRIECVFDAQFNNLAKSIAYALSGFNGKYNNCEKQNLIWNSQIWVDHGADAKEQR